MMSKVGEILRKRRESEGISIEDVATQTMIAKKYIVALEEGDYNLFPGKVYAKGFLRNYANFLEFREDEIKNLVSQYELEWQENQSKLPTSKPEKTIAIPQATWSFYTIIFILAVGILLLLVFYIVKHTSRDESMTSYFDPSKILREEDISTVEDIIIRKKIEELKNIIEKEEKEMQIKDAEPQQVWLEAIASERVWMHATIDGKEEREVLLYPNQKIKWQAEKEIYLTLGNAGGIVFKLNDRYIGSLGKRGEVKKLLVTSMGINVIKTHEPVQKKEEEKVDTLAVFSSGSISQPTSTPTLKEQVIPTTAISEE